MARIIPSIFLLLCLRLVFPLLFWLYLSTFLYLYVYLSLSSMSCEEKTYLWGRGKKILFARCVPCTTQGESHFLGKVKQKNQLLRFLIAFTKSHLCPRSSLPDLIDQKKTENWISHLNQWRCDHSSLKLSIKLHQTWIETSLLVFDSTFNDKSTNHHVRQLSEDETSVGWPHCRFTLQRLFM